MVQGPQHHVGLSILRDAYSLFPQNDAFLDWLEQLLRIRCGHAFYALRDHCAEQDVILYLHAGNMCIVR